MKIGILSDTHGVLKDTFLDELQSCDYLLHAGDIGSLKCYETLKDLHVPLYIIKGNCDKGEWTKYLPETLAAPIGGKIFYLIHKKSNLPYPQPEADFIITGQCRSKPQWFLLYYRYSDFGWGRCFYFTHLYRIAIYIV